MVICFTIIFNVTNIFFSRILTKLIFHSNDFEIKQNYYRALKIDQVALSDCPFYTKQLKKFSTNDRYKSSPSYLHSPRDLSAKAGSFFQLLAV